MNKPLVSVILPNHNYGHFISEAIQSVLNQSYTNFELWVIDDGSTDNSREIIEKWSVLAPEKVNSVLSEKKGLSFARNKGLSESRGEIIAFLDSDDVWERNYLSAIVEHFEKNKSSQAVYTNAEVFEAYTNRVLGNWFGPNAKRRCFSGEVSDKLFVHGNFIPICTAAIRRQVFESAGGFDEKFRLAEDLDFWIRVSMRHPIDYLDENLCRIRRHSCNASFLYSNAYHVMRVYQKNIQLFPEFTQSINRNTVNKRWHELYYEIGRHLTLSGKKGTARLFFRKALCYRPDIFTLRFWLYYPLTYFSYLKQVIRFRLEIVKMRKRLVCAAD